MLNLNTKLQQMDLSIFSDHISRDNYDYKDVSSEEITMTLEKLDWNIYHQIVLGKDESNYIEITGILNTNEISCIYMVNNNIKDFDNIPSTFEEIKDILLSYFHDCDGFNKLHNKKLETEDILNFELLNRAQKRMRPKNKMLFFKYLYNSRLFYIIIFLIPIAGTLIFLFVDKKIDTYAVFIFLVLSVWCVFEIFRMINKRNLKVSKKNNLDKLKSEIHLHKPRLITENIPNELTSYISIFEKWGIKNKVLRQNLYEESEDNELLELKSIEPVIPQLKSYISKYNSDNIEEREAIKLTLKAYHDLGLWTWD